MSFKDEINGYIGRILGTPLGGLILYGIANANMESDMKYPIVPAVVGAAVGFMLGYSHDQAFKYKRLNKKLEHETKELEGIIEDLKSISMIDPLTKLNNKKAFEEMLDHEWDRVKRENQYLSCLVCDIDYFKNYNDEYGHMQGDVCLKQVATILKSAVRSSDYTARWGGEEFAVILPNTNLGEAQIVAKKILVDIEAKSILHERSDIADHITLSIGCVTTRPDSTGLSTGDFFKLGDQALYLAKDMGRNTFYSDEFK